MFCPVWSRKMAQITTQIKNGIISAKQRAMYLFAMKSCFFSILILGCSLAFAQPVPIFLEGAPFDTVMTTVGKSRNTKIQRVAGRDTLVTQTLLSGQKSRIEARYWVERTTSKQWMTESYAIFDSERQARNFYDDWMVWLLSENAEPVKFGETDTSRNVVSFIPHSDTYTDLMRGEWPTYLNKCSLELRQRPDKRFEVVFMVEKRQTVLTSSNGR